MDFLNIYMFFVYFLVFSSKVIKFSVYFWTNVSSKWNPCFILVAFKVCVNVAEDCFLTYLKYVAVV